MFEGPRVSVGEGKPLPCSNPPADPLNAGFQNSELYKQMCSNLAQTVSQRAMSPGNEECMCFACSRSLERTFPDLVCLSVQGP